MAAARERHPRHRRGGPALAPARGILSAVAFAVILAVFAGCGGATSTATLQPTPTLQPTAAASPASTAAPTPTAAPTATSIPEPSTEPTLFGSILEAVPEGTPLFGYTNWSQIKADAGIPTLGSRSPMAERVAFLSRFGRERAAGSSFGLARFGPLAETWGFDSTDLAWELVGRA